MALQNVIQPRLLAFEYVLKRLLEWNKEITQSDINDLSTLKAIKLLFFVSAVNARRGRDNILIDAVFKDFVAMPYGHVESVIYSEIRNKKGVLNYYRIDNTHTSIIEGKDPQNLPTEVPANVRQEIDFAINTLKSINYNLVTFSAFELVDLSHAWYSWKKTFANAKVQGLGSLAINREDILTEDKIFSLQIF